MGLLKWLAVIVLTVLVALAVINNTPFLRNLAGQGAVQPTGPATALPWSDAPK